MLSGSATFTSKIEMCALLTCQPTGHQLQEGAAGVDDPGAEEAEDLGTHDVGQVGLMSQGWKTKQLWWNAQ